MKFIRCMAGFPTHPGSYFLGRAHFQPPTTIIQPVFPWLRNWEVRFRQRNLGKNWKNGGLDKPDIAGWKFTELLGYLRIVFLQDMAILQASKL